MKGRLPFVAVMQPLLWTIAIVCLLTIAGASYTPVFDKEEINVYVEENRTPGTPISTITVNDTNSEYNVHYTLVDGDTDSFDINSNSGTLITLVGFDYEGRNEYYVKVRATSVTFVNDVKVFIHILDVNDNRPVINDFDIYFNNFDGYFPDEDIGQVPAYDPDVSDVLTYGMRFADGNRKEFLLLNRSTGGIKLNPIMQGRVIPQIIPFYVEVSGKIFFFFFFFFFFLI